MAPLRVGHDDSGVVEQQSGGAIEFHLRFLVSCHRRHQIRFDLRQRALILQDGGRRRYSGREFLLFGVECLAGEIDRGPGGINGSAVLLDIELRIADFDAHLVFELLQAHLGLAVFEFRAHLVSLGGAVAQWNIQSQSQTFIGRGRGNQLVQGRAVTDRASVAEGRRGFVFIETEVQCWRRNCRKWAPGD